MREAAFADIDAKLRHQSALSKVRMLEGVKKQLNKYGTSWFITLPHTSQGIGIPITHEPFFPFPSRSHVHNAFLDNGLLEAMKLWLEPLQDASLPSLDIIQDFLHILDIVSASKTTVSMDVMGWKQACCCTDVLTNGTNISHQ